MKLPVIQPAEYIHTGEHASGVASTFQLSARAALPIFLSTHIAFFLLTYLSPLFLLPDFSDRSLPIAQLLHAWDKWDTGNFITLATQGYLSMTPQGYTPIARTAFFPLYPLLIRAMMYLGISPLLAGLIISNLANFAMLVVLHRLTREDFGRRVARLTILFISIFPTAFFFAAAYNESLFLALILLSFYEMRHGRFWLAGLIGVFASLTRSAGLLLLVPFIYEYAMRGKRKADALAIVLIPLGTLLFAVYCNVLFHDPLAFMHAQANWQRHLDWPWWGMRIAYQVIRHRPLLSFYSLHNVIDLGAGLGASLAVFLSFVGPFRFRGYHRSYALFGLALLLFPLVVPAGEPLPLVSLSRLCLEVFPIFIIMGKVSVKYPALERGITMVSVSLLALLSLQFVTGHWLV